MKRFYNNTKMSRVFSKTLRMIALLCVLMGFSSSAWGATCYIDATSITEAGNTVLVNWFRERQTNNDISVTEVTTGVWSFEYPSVELKIEFKINNDYKQKEPILVSNKNCIKFTYENGGLNYTWTERNPYMGMPIYFQPGSDWKADNAWFAVYFFDDKNHAEWKRLEPSICDPSAFVTTTPNYADWNWSKISMIFCRMNPQYNDLSWDGDGKDRVWTQTVNQARHDDWINDGDLNIFNTGRTWAQIITPWDSDSDPNNNSSDATIQWYNTSCTEQAEDYSLAGTFNNWSKKSHKFSVGKGASGSVEVELTEGSYRFKLLKNESIWYGNNATITNVTSSSGLEFTGDGGDCTFKAEKDGVYTFTFGENWLNDGVGGKKAGMWLTVTYSQAKEPVLLAYPASYNNQKTQVKLSAYIQKTYCTDGGGQITDWGFVICPGTATSACVPTTTSLAKSPSPRDAKLRGEIFEHTLYFTEDNLVGGAMYGYRGYVKIGGKMYLTKETGTFFFPGDCTQQEINGTTPIIYTIDASLGEDYADDCNLRYGSLQEALNRLRALAKDDNVEAKYKYATYDNENRSLNLNVPIEFHVAYYDDTPDDASKAYCYEGDTKAGVSGGGSSSENSYALIINEINRKNTGTRYTLTIKGSSEKTRPWLHHVIVRESKDVILDNLAIFSDPTNELQDDALEFDCNSKEWHALTVGKIEDANIVVKNCMIGSNGFTGVHASAYDGITFENNEFEAIMATTGDLGNAVSWGASAKFIACENIKFIRNNFRGAHATLVWFQDSKNALFMNNVFWNTNQYEANCSAIRLVNQFDKTVEKVGFYYNTFYLAEDGGDSAHKYDFLHYSSIGTSYFENIEFKYNNCYSYDESVPGKDQNPESKNVSGGVYCPNNFWSKYDDKNNKTKSVFAFGSCDDANIMVNVSDIVCVTTASGPASLVIKGGTDKSENSLNVGVKPTIEEIQGATGQIVSDEDLTYDRYNKGARPAENGWTYGAYQAKEDITVKTIYWIGIDEKWDNRNNWGYYESDIVKDNSLNANNNAGSLTRSAGLQRLSCINNLDNELKAVIPEHPLVQIEGGRKWPKVPTSFDPDIRKSESGIPVTEQVTTKDGTKFADNIEVEYGAAIKGIEHLVNGGEHYGSATTHFIAPRSEWILVGTVVKPWIDPDDINKGTRDMKSGDYYIDGRTPNVYVHQVVLENGNPTWNTPFSSLEEPLEAGKVFAMMVPDEYGTYKLPMQYYKQLVDPNASFDPTEPIVYGKYQGSKGPFTGRFVNEKPVNQGYPISYNNLSSGPNLLNNSYTYNIDAKKVESGSKGTIQYYDSEARAFFTTSSTPGDVILKPQHGFIFTPKSGATTLNIEYGMFNDGNTRSRAAVEELPTFSLNLYNANANSGYSNIAVRMDEFLGEGNQSEMDVEKAFVNLSGTPELYIIAYDSKYSRVDYFSTEQPIPLGVRLKESMNIRFEKAWFRGFTEATLFDKLTGKEYDLLNRTYTTETLQAGDIEGRFFLNLSDNEIYVPDDEEEDGDDTPTSVEENTEDTNSINIFLRESDSTIRVITNGVELRNIYINDMTGKTMSYNVSGYFAEINLPVAQGVYMIHVVGDTASRTEKVILK